MSVELSFFAILRSNLNLRGIEKLLKFGAEKAAITPCADTHTRYSSLLLPMAEGVPMDAKERGGLAQCQQPRWILGQLKIGGGEGTNRV